MLEHLGIHPIRVSKDLEGKLLAKLDSATALEATQYAKQLGVTPPTERSGWVIGKLMITGTNRGGDETSVFNGLVWNEPDYPFSREMDRDYSVEDVWSDDVVVDPAD